MQSPEFYFQKIFGSLSEEVFPSIKRATYTIFFLRYLRQLQACREMMSNLKNFSCKNKLVLVMCLLVLLVEVFNSLISQNILFVGFCSDFLALLWKEPDEAERLFLSDSPLTGKGNFSFRYIIEHILMSHTSPFLVDYTLRTLLWSVSVQVFVWES